MFRPRGVPVKSFVNGTFAAIGAGILLVSFGIPGTADADPPYGYGDSQLHGAIVKPDGSILAGGDNPARFLIQFKPDGTVDSGFSNGGVKKFPNVDPVSGRLGVMPAGTSGAIVVTEDSLTKLKADGEPDPSFGVGGVVADIAGSVFGTSTIGGVTTRSDGKIMVLSGYYPSGEQKIARFKPNGQLDDAFGVGGVVDLAIPAALEHADLGVLRLDDANRILIVGVVDSQPAAVRYLADGTPDTGFGPDDSGFVIAEGAGGPFGLEAVVVDGDGAFRVYASDGAVYFGGSNSVSFDANGSRGPNGYYGGITVFGETPDGGVLTDIYPGRIGDTAFDLVKAARGGGGFPGFSFNAQGLTQDGYGRIEDVTYSSGDDSLIVTGSAHFDNCSASGCVGHRSMAMVKADAGTGALDPDFGIGGYVLMPKNKCAFGVAPAVGRPIPWSRCIRKAPEVKAKVRFIRGASRKPGITGSVSLSDAQDIPILQSARVVVKLPDRLKRRAHQTAKPVSVTISIPPLDYFERDDPANMITARLEGRSIVLDFRPYQTLYGDEEFPAENHNPPFTLDFTLKRGNLKPVPRKLRRKKLNFRIAGSYGTPGSQWYAPGTKKTVVKTRAVKPRKQS